MGVVIFVLCDELWDGIGLIVGGKDGKVLFILRLFCKMLILRLIIFFWVVLGILVDKNRFLLLWDWIFVIKLLKIVLLLKWFGLLVMFVNNFW